ncbi:PAS domain S-box protein [Chlorogloeopsis sp. ULAP01]|uniref:PAS domain S-box protein n=1 Tax=Chlorogloeopsis sp. ULAP01 TaxID=3056483 RepID=UPI0025AA83E0|nr:PAS domain S-box protein [Chlorogloeopsis sp. ULAP01]MDM9379555.1 PAS domain S-box protein [Chlorogloeopsis sp. ULAP01]
MLTHRTVIVIADSDESNNDYEHQLQQDVSFAYRILTERYRTKILTLSQSQQIDGILLELNSRHSGSFDFLRQMKEQMGDRCPPIVVIGSGDAEIVVQAFKNGATEYLIKERLTPDDLRLGMRSAIKNAQLQRELQRNQEQFQTSIENMLDCFGIFSSMRDESGQIVDFRIDYLNAAACDNNRMPKHKQIGRGLCELLPAHRASGLFDEYCRLVETGEALIKDSLVYEDTYGEQQLVRAFDIRATKLNDGFVASWRDITDRKRMELELSQTAAALNASQQLYRELAQAMPQMVWTADARGFVNYWNQRWHEYTGLNEAESMGLAGITTVHPDERDRTLEQWQQSVANGERFEIEYRICRWDGVYHWFICRGIPTQDSQGQLTGWIGTITDIDHQKRLEEKLLNEIANHQHTEQNLRAANQKITNILESMTDAFVALDPDWRITYVNQMTARINQVSPEELIGKSHWEVWAATKNSILEENYQRAIAEQIPVHFEYFYESRQRWYEVHAYPAPDGLGIYYCDISDRKQIEYGLRQQAAQLEQTNLTLQETLEELQVAQEELRQQNEELVIAHNLAEAEGKRYRDLFNFAPNGYVVTDANGMIQEANQAIATLVVINQSYLVNKPLAVYISDSDLRAFRNLLNNLYRQSQAQKLQTEELSLKSANGHPIPVAITGTAMRDAQGRIAGVRWLIQDITERKQAQAALAANEARLRGFVDANVVGILYGDIYGNINEANDELLRIIGYTQEDLRAGRLRWIDLTPSEYLPLDEQAIAEARANGACTPYEKEYIRKDGSRVPVLVGYSLVGEAREESVAFILDLSDRKQAEEALRLSEEHYRYLAEAIPQLVWTCNASGVYDYVNQRLCEYIGLSFEQIIGTGWLCAVHPNDLKATQAAWMNAVHHGSCYRHEYRLRRAADHSYRWHLALGLPLKDKQGRVVKWFGTCTDIHDQKELEIEREHLLQLERAAREAAERANRIKDEFLAVLSHELRAPLNPILGWAKLLQTRKLNENKMAEAFATIERNARLQTQLIDDLLDVARILRGKLSINATSVNLASVIAAAIDTVKTAAIAKSISLHPELPNIGQASGDTARLQQIVWNLLSNAIKFTPNHGQVNIKLQRVENQAEIKVTDTGKGINPNFLPHIFESFRQEDASITRKYGGLGLGLAIVRQLVEAHGGTISADSPGEGLGATFTVRLPLLKVEPEIQQTDELPQKELNLMGIRILAVDDDPDARELLTVLLTQYGAEVLSVASAPEVLANLASFQPDVLVSDIGMPDVDGYTLLQQIRTLSPAKGGQVPAIALTAYARENDYQRALTCGFQRHVTKPLEPEQLVQAVVALVPDKIN